jgi:monoamine oxidase
MDNPQAFYYLGGARHRAADCLADPGRMGFAVADGEHGKTCGQMWAEALQPLALKLDELGEAAWEMIVAQYDHYSTREFLEFCGWSESAIEMFGLIANQESVMNSSFLELFREEAGH